LVWNGPVPTWRGVIGVMITASLAFGGAGCGSKRPRVYPVIGEVFWEGKPAVGAVVFLHPVTDKLLSNESPAVGRQSVGRVSADGSFKVSTYGANDGAPIGRYRVTLVWSESGKDAGPDEEEVSLLPPEYGNPETSPLEIIEVKAEKNVLPPFRIPK
jgi:hypothetical protein